MKAAPLDPSRPQPQPPPREEEARTLAVLLRSSRLTLLRGADGADRARLLRDGVMPLLHRRASDAAPGRSRPSAQVLNFPDRRSPARPGATQPAVELALLLDSWQPNGPQAPMAALQAQLALLLDLPPLQVAAAGTTLATRLHVLSQRFGARFLLVCDGFEEALRAATGHPAMQHFLDELSTALRGLQPPLNVLLSVSDEAEALLGRFLEQFPGLAAPPLRLSHWDPGAPHARGRPAVQLVPPATGGAPVTADLPAQRSADVAPVADTDWASSIDLILARVATQVRADRVADADPAAPTDDDPTIPFAFAPLAQPPAADEPEPTIEHVSLDFGTPAPPGVAEPAPRPERPPEPVAPAVDLAIAQDVASAPAAAPASTPAGPRRPWLAIGAGAAFVAAVLLWLAWPAANPPLTAPPPIARAPLRPPAPATAPLAVAPPAIVPAAPSATTAALPSLLLASDGDDGLPSALAADLARLLGTPAGSALRVEPSFGWAEALAAPAGTQRIAIARYDALQAERTHTPGAALRLLTPLVREQIHFVVRADSPLKWVHEIEGARINVGPPLGSRALTAQTVYQRLFDHPLPTAQVDAATRDTALAELLDTRRVDVLMVVDAQPSDWLARLPPARAAAIRLLALDPANPASRRALRSYLPATQQAGVGAAAAQPGLAVMSFLVASGDPAAAPKDAAPAALRALCAGLPALRRDGHPAWREFQPGLALPAGWPYAAEAAAGLRDCPRS